MKKVFLITIIALFSCNQYLEESPNSAYDVALDDLDKISEVLTAAYPNASYFMFLEPRTDNVAEREGGEYYRLNEAMYFWQDDDEEDLDTPLNYWNECYKGIAEVNQVLESLKKYPNKTERIKALYGEALVLRAYLHFMIANIWATPYNPNTAQNDMGIPYVTQPEKKSFATYDRENLSITYAKIEKDLEIGLPLINDKYYTQPSYHFNKKAALAFATRFHLYKGNWQKVVEYANYVLGINPYGTLRNWDLENYGNYNFSVKENYTSPQEKANLLIVPTESRLNKRFKNEKYGLDINKSAELFSAFYPPLEIGFYYNRKISGVEGSTAKYIDKFKDFTTVQSVGVNPREVYTDNVLLTTDEVLLNRAEALIMQQNYNEAILDIRSFLRAKTSLSLLNDEIKNTFTNAQDTYTSAFTAMTFYQANLLTFVAELRRREFVHEGLRWFDIRRFYLSVNRNIPGKPLQLQKILKKEDYRKTLQIPTTAISNGITPNPR